MTELFGAALGWVVLRKVFNQLVYGILFGLISGMMVRTRWDAWEREGIWSVVPCTYVVGGLCARLRHVYPLTVFLSASLPRLWMLLLFIAGRNPAHFDSLPPSPQVFIALKELLPTAHRYDPEDKVVTISLIGGMIIMAASLVLFLF